MTEIREKALAFAVSHYLSFYPEEKSFEEIVQLVRDSEWSDELVAWEPFEDSSGDWIADQIELMACLLEATFG
jgi:hypothetical protein